MDEDEQNNSESDSEELFSISRAKATVNAGNSDDERDSDAENSEGAGMDEEDEDFDTPNNFVMDRVIKVDGLDLPYEKLNKIAGETLITVGKGNLVKTYVTSFAQLGISDWLLENIESKLHWTIPTHVQQMTIPALLSGRDLQVASPTGSGKTAAFLVPILQLVILQKLASTSNTPSKRSKATKESKETNNEETEKSEETLPPVFPLNLVVAPTIELAKQIYHQALLLCDSPAAAGVSVELLHKSAITRRQETLAGKSNNQGKKKNTGLEDDNDEVSAAPSNSNLNSETIDLVVTTPSRLIQLVESKAIDLSRVHHLVLDEVDRLMTDELLGQADAIISASNGSKSRRIAFFSATIMPSVENLAVTVLQNPVRARIGVKNTAADHVTQKLVYTGSEEGKLMALRRLLTSGEVRAPVLIFMQSKNRTAQLLEGFGGAPGFSMDYITGDRTEGQRRNALLKFRSGETTVLVTTDLLARGLDFKAVATVINFDMPTSSTTYIHRIGRTGRVGGVTGQAWTLFTDADIEHISPLANVMMRSGQSDNIPPWVLLQASKKKERPKASNRNVVKRENVGGGFEGLAVQGKKKNKFINPSRVVEEEIAKKKAEKDKSHKSKKDGRHKHSKSDSPKNPKKRSRSNSGASSSSHAPPNKIKSQKL